MKFINLDNVVSVEISKEKKTDYKWFKETTVINKYWFFFSEKYVVPEGWGTEEATLDNTFMYLGMSFESPIRYTSKQLIAADHILKNGIWYKKACIRFMNNNCTIYKSFESDSELQEIIDLILEEKPNLIALT